MNDTSYLLSAIVVMAACTFFLRMIPFAVLKKVKGNRLLEFFGQTMPPGIMLILVVFSISSVDFSSKPFGAPVLISMVAVAIIHHLWRKALLSIVLGTGVHMILLQLM